MSLIPPPLKKPTAGMYINLLRDVARSRDPRKVTRQILAELRVQLDALRP